MKPVDQIYWIKFLLGMLAAVVCVLLNIENLITGAGVGILTYLISDKILKQLFINKIDKPSTVTKTGIGIYVITFVFLWTLLYTILHFSA